MKKLTVALVLVALLILPVAGLAGEPPNSSPPKGTNNFGVSTALNLLGGALYWNAWLAYWVIDELINGTIPPTPWVPGNQ